MQKILLFLVLCCTFAVPGSLSAVTAAATVTDVQINERTARLRPDKKGKKLRVRHLLRSVKQKIRSRRHAAAPAEGKPETTALISMIAGIASFPFVFLLWPLGLLLAIAAIVLGIIGLSKINESNGFFRGKGMAIAGIVTGSLLIVLFIVAVILLFLFFASLF